VPESQARDIRAGSAVTIMADSTQPTPGKVERVYAESVAGSVRVDIGAQGLERALTGAKVSVAIDLGRRTAILIPARFVRTQYGLDTVNLRTSSTTSAPAAITVQTAPGPTADQREVLSGLSAGDVLVAPEVAK
jgi:hypothetical protein